MSFSWGGYPRKHCQVCISLSSLRMLGEPLSEGIYVGEYLEFPPRLSALYSTHKYMDKVTDSRNCR